MTLCTVYSYSCSATDLQRSTLVRSTTHWNSRKYGWPEISWSITVWWILVGAIWNSPALAFMPSWDLGCISGDRLEIWLTGNTIHCDCAVAWTSPTVANNSASVGLFQWRIKAQTALKETFPISRGPKIS